MSDPADLKYFKKIYEHVDTPMFLAEVERQESEWLRRTGRQKLVGYQNQTQAITLRGVPLSLIPTGLRKLLGLKLANSHWSVWTPESRNFPLISGFLTKFARERGGQLGRAMIVRLEPNGHVSEHIDEGAYYEKRDRYHFVLKSPGGSVLNSGGESVTMQQGELWWFNNSELHSASNPAGDWRIHIIFDLSPKQLKQ